MTFLSSNDSDLMYTVRILKIIDMYWFAIYTVVCAVSSIIWFH